MSRAAVALVALLAWAGPTGPASADFQRSADAFDRALAAERGGEAETAREEYRLAIELDGGFVEAMVNLARMELAAGELEGARHTVARAAAIRTDYPDLHKVLGLIALAEERPRDAIGALERARQLDPRDIETLVNLSAAYLVLGALGDAERVLERARQLDPDCVLCCLNLALVLDAGGEHARAAFLYQRFLLRVATDDPDRAAVEARLRLLRAGKR